MVGRVIKTTCKRDALFWTKVKRFAMHVMANACSFIKQIRISKKTFHPPHLIRKCLKSHAQRRKVSGTRGDDYLTIFPASLAFQARCQRKGGTIVINFPQLVVILISCIDYSLRSILWQPDLEFSADTRRSKAQMKRMSSHIPPFV